MFEKQTVSKPDFHMESGVYNTLRMQTEQEFIIFRNIFHSAYV